MDLQNLTLYQMSGEKMRWLAQRQTVLAHNIANGDTPNFMPSDIEPLTFKEFVGESKHVPMMRTNPAHRTRGSGETKIAKTNVNHLSPIADGKARVREGRRPFETSIDKNGVILEEQMAKVDETRTQHEQVTALFKKNAALLGTALGLK
ncbi:MAG: flagellar biosynthesis protein FlgB [Alphaproteobacteria bacterium]|nr:flagellar biosynthesis protein FlgB [Alphaproteobacteria bacterium]